MPTNWERVVLTGGALPYRVAVEVYAGGSWCDINKLQASHVDDVWYRRLKVKPSRITVKSETNSGRFTSSSSDLIIDNDDAALSREEWTLYNADGVECVLDTWYHAKLRIRIGYKFGSETITWESLGVFEIEDVVCNRKGRTASVKLVGLERGLKDKKAKECREGDTWLTNIRIADFIEQLIVRANSGTTEFESGSPYSAPMSVDSRVASVIGNFPVTLGGEWNREKRYIPSFGLNAAAGGYEFYWVGYDARDNHPCVIKWNAGTAEWTVIPVYPSTAYLGYVGVFSAWGAGANAGKLYVFSISNTTGRYDDQPRLNLYQRITKVDLSTGACTHVSTSRVYLPHMFPIWPNTAFTDGSTSLWGWGTWNGAGTHVGEDPNIPVFFPSRVCCPQNDEEALRFCTRENAATSTSEVHIMEGIEDVGYSDLRTDYVTQSRQFRPGRYSAAMEGSTADVNSPLRIWLHTMHHEAYRHNPQRDTVNFLRYEESGGTMVPRLYTFNLETENLVGAAIYLPSHTTPNPHMISAFHICDEDGTTPNSRIWLALAYDLGHDGTLGHVDPKAKLVRANLKSASTSYSSGDWTELTFGAGGFTRDWDDRYFPIIITIRHNASNMPDGLPIMGQALNVYASGGPCYGMWYHGSTAGSNFWRGFSDSDLLPQSTMPLVFTADPAHLGGGITRHYVLDQGTGSLWLVEYGGGGTTAYMTAEAKSIGPVDGENVWACCNPIMNRFMGYHHLVGVNASSTPANVKVPVKLADQWDGQPDYAPYTPGGRLSTWQYHNTIGDVIPVADSGDAYVWKAAEWARQITADQLMGYNREGLFRFAARASGAAQWTIFCRGIEYQHPAATTIPCQDLESRIDAPSVINSASISPWIGETRPPEYKLQLTHDSTGEAITIAVASTGKRAQRVVLTCVSPGTPPDPDDTTAKDRPLLFGFRKEYDEISTSLSSDAYGTAQAVYVYGLWEDEQGDAKLGDTVVRPFDTLQVGDGDIVQIKSISVTQNKITVLADLGGATLHKTGETVTIYPRDKWRYGDSTDGVCTLTADAVLGAGVQTFTVDDTSLLQSGTVVYVDTAYVHVLVVEDGTHFRGKPEVLGTGVGASGTWPSQTRLRAAIWISTQGRSYAIADTGVSVAFQTKTVESETQGVFAVGDRIVVTSHGLGVVQMEHVNFRMMRSESIERYGTKEWPPASTNRFITPVRAQHIKHALAGYEFPPYLTVARGCPLVPTVEIGQIVEVIDEHLFPDVRYNTVKHHIVGIMWNVRGGTMELTMRSLEAAGRGDNTSVAEAGAAGIVGWPAGEYHSRRRPS